MFNIISVLIFILYQYVVYKYAHSLFFHANLNSKIHIKFFVINTIIFSLSLLLKLTILEPIIIIFYCLIVFFEQKAIYKMPTLINIFGVLSFSVNFFAVRFIYICLFSTLHNIPVYEFMKNFDMMAQVCTFTFATCSIYISLFIITPSKQFLDLLLTDKGNIKFYISLLAFIQAYQLFITYMFYIEKDLVYLNALVLKASICSFIGFFSALFYSYMFSKLKLYVEKSKDIEKEIEIEQLQIQELENESIYDYFTKCYKRDYIYEKIDNLLKSDNPFFSVAFIDIDGLKIANDVYGHDEGDFYIKAVVEILKEEFIGKNIARLGGDEFLVVLEHTDLFATMKCLVRCFEKVEHISKFFNKPYSTSISYGVVEILPDNKLTRDEIISLADAKMYQFKKSRRKNRK